MTEINPRTGEKAPSDAKLWHSRRWIEKCVMAYASRVVFASPGAYRIYRDRYPEVSRERFALIANGYDEYKFLEAKKSADKSNDTRPDGKRDQIVLLHSGVLYYSADRDPTCLFAALGKLRSKGIVSPRTLRVVLRASGYEEQYRKLLKAYQIDDLVVLEPAITYGEALAEMLAADGLLIFQGYTSNPAIPAKLYEYLRAQRPIFALVDPKGDTASVLAEAGVGTMVPLDSIEEIAEGLETFLKEVRSHKARTADMSYVKRFSRQSQAAELAAILDEVTGIPR